MESDLAEAISGFEHVGPNTPLSQSGVEWGYYLVWANTLLVHIEVNAIDDRADISLELTNMRVSRRATLMPQSCTVTWPQSSTYITTFFNHLRETSRRNKTPWSKIPPCLRSDSKSSTQCLLLKPSFVSFSSLPLAAHPFPSSTAPPFLLLLQYSPLAPMYYPSHPNLPISLCIPS